MDEVSQITLNLLNYMYFVGLLPYVLFVRPPHEIIMIVIIIIERCREDNGRLRFGLKERSRRGEILEEGEEKVFTRE